MLATQESYIKVLHVAGGSIGIVIAATQGIISAHDRSLLAENGGSLLLTKDWALSLLKWKASPKANSRTTKENCVEVKKRCLDQIVPVVTMAEIPHNLIINLDQTGMKFVPGWDRTMTHLGSKGVEIAGLDDKRQISTSSASSLDWHFWLCRFCIGAKLLAAILISPFLVIHLCTPNHWAN